MNPRTTESAALGIEVLRQESQAVAALAERLDGETFSAAVDLLSACSGNVATVGAGTSGILARKLAATLTSTGTPALFVHPGDALHGGLGAIGGQEVVIAISNGGETEEVLALLPYLRSREVPVIAIVGQLDSTLGRQCTLALEAWVEREAGSLDLVPTASAAVALALGDALAVAVMERKGVTPEAFAANHPSGRLGRRLTLRVRDVMHDAREAATVAAGDRLISVVSEITRSGLGAAIVVDDAGALEGIITDGDVRRSVQRSDPATLGAMLAREVMTQNPVVVAPDEMASNALSTMEDRPSQIDVLPVVEGGACVGLVRLHDLVRMGL